MPVVRTDGRSGGWLVVVRSHDYQIFSEGFITSFSYLWCSAGTLRARELHKNKITTLVVRNNQVQADISGHSCTCDQTWVSTNGRYPLVGGWTNREYYMATWRYEISLWVCSLVKYFSTWEEKFLISKWPCDVLFYYINTNEMPNHFTSIFFCCKRCNLLCSHRNGDLFTSEKITGYFHL